jgi:hypothetical protein
MKVVKRLVAPCSYTTKAGEEKTKWVEMGAMWKKDDGNFILNISAVPTVNWDGWVLLRDPWEDREEAQVAEVKQDSKQEEIPEDDIPF